MKQIILILIVFFPTVAYGFDNYNISNPQWKTCRQLEEDLMVCSISKLDETELITILNKYNMALKLFHREKNWGYCKSEMVRVYLVRSRKELSNMSYFPSELDYDSTTEQIRGRFYRHNNTIYVAPYYELRWGFYFAHELLHHFINECGVPFKNIEEEHEFIDKFLYKYDNRF